MFWFESLNIYSEVHYVPFCFIWIRTLWVYGHYIFFNYVWAGIVFKRQNIVVKFWRLYSAPVLRGLLQCQRGTPPVDIDVSTHAAAASAAAAAVAAAAAAAAASVCVVMAWIYYCHLHLLQAATCCRNSRLLVEKDDLKWVKKQRKFTMYWQSSFMEILMLKPLVVGKLDLFSGM